MGEFITEDESIMAGTMETILKISHNFPEVLVYSINHIFS